VFHVEQIIKQECASWGVTITDEQAEKLFAYARFIIEENQKYNLTGLKTVEDVQRTLLAMSVKPLARFSVPRGTKFADVGTGSGVPGIVLAVCFPDLEGTLMDANNKKTEFIMKAAEMLSLGNVKAVNGRVEDLGRQSDLRESFDWCFTRAFGPLYYSVEFGFPFLKQGGKLYVYSTFITDDLSSQMRKHVLSCGGSLVKTENMPEYGIEKEGVLLIKEKKSPNLYPRKFPVVKRESLKIPESEQNRKK
jgi:16S rRNA (guanine527-N7)-methyltransferase